MSDRRQTFRRPPSRTHDLMTLLQALRHPGAADAVHAGRVSAAARTQATGDERRMCFRNSSTVPIGAPTPRRAPPPIRRTASAPEDRVARGIPDWAPTYGLIVA